MNFNNTKQGNTDVADYTDYYSDCGEYCLRFSTIRLARNKPGKITTFKDSATGKIVTITSNAGYPPMWYALRKIESGWGLLHSGRNRQAAEKTIRQHAKRRGVRTA